MANEDVIANLRKRIADISENGAGPSAPLFQSDEDSNKREHDKRSRKNSKGQVVPGPQESDDEAERAFKKVIALVNISDRSEKALRERLKKEEFEDPAIDEAVERAKSYGFVDDMRFADVLIRSRISQGKGTAGIERELAGHDIDLNEVPGWPFEYGVDSEVELDRALSFLDRKPPRSKNLREGAYRKLVQKGFSTSVASSAARMWSERQDCPE